MVTSRKLAAYLRISTKTALFLYRGNEGTRIVSSETVTHLRYKIFMEIRNILSCLLHDINHFPVTDSVTGRSHDSNFNFLLIHGGSMFYDKLCLIKHVLINFSCCTTCFTDKFCIIRNDIPA